jgi:glycosyltransferase involved in cell wall biosynthesis
VIPHGLELDGHGERTPRMDGAPPTIGYFARICKDKGLHVLAEACDQLARRRPDLPFRLQFAGYLGHAEKAYLAQVESRLASGPLRDRYAYLGELDRQAKISFLQTLDVFSVPTVYRESKGLPALEAMANAVPVVLPEHGSFPELVRDTGGGLLHRPVDPADLAERLEQLLTDGHEAHEMGRRGRAAVIERYNARTMAEATRSLYGALVDRN